MAHIAWEQPTAAFSDPINKKETILGTGKLANNSMLAKLWLLKENLKPLIYQTSVTARNNL